MMKMCIRDSLITVPSELYKNYVIEKYRLNNVHVIGGYPMASYVNDMSIEDSNIIKARYGIDEFAVLVFGGDVKSENIPKIIQEVETVSYTHLNYKIQ